jgi:anti-sigma regulatory factor (Ser/Thr protein kinase)
VTDFGNDSGTDCRLAIAAGPAAVGEAAAAARAFGNAAGIGPDLTARLSIIVEELVANLIDHAALSPGASIRLELALVDNAVRLILDDPGAAFDPRAASLCAGLPPARGGGAGLAMIRAWSQIESYASADGRNTLVLRLTTPPLKG